MTAVDPTPRREHPFFRDVRTHVANYAFDVIFDVGANRGQSTALYRKVWPAAKIFAFEPVPETHQKLLDSVKGDPRVTCELLALSSQSQGVARMTQRVNSAANQIITETKEATVEVRLDTGDDYCQRHSVEHIHFLKVDTEGHDLSVLVGFSKQIAANKIDFIQVEAGVNSENRTHVPFERFFGFLRPYGYELFGFYDAYVPGRGRLAMRRANLVFASSKLVAAKALAATET